MHSALQELPAYDRPTMHSLHHLASANGWSHVLLSGNKESIIIWSLIIVAALLLLIWSKAPQKGPQTLFGQISNQLEGLNKAAVLSACLALCTIIACVGLKAKHDTELSYLAKPPMSRFYGSYHPDQNGGKPDGLTHVRVTPHDIYGSMNGKLIFDFHYTKAIYYHGLFLDPNYENINSGNNHSTHTVRKKISYTARLSPTDRNGVLLIGHYRSDPYHFASQFTNGGLLDAHQNYGVTGRTYKSYDTDLKLKHYHITNAGHRFPLPRPNTTMVVALDHGSLSISPLGARQINDYSGSNSILKKYNTLHADTRRDSNGYFDR